MAVFLKCQFCGNAYTSPPRNVGDVCGVNDCTGKLILHPYIQPAQRREMLKCDDCGNIYFSPPRNFWEKCGVNGCNGILRRVY